MLTPLVKLGCPYCRAQIETPFARGEGRTPVVNTHPKPGDPHGPRCRVVVVVDPIGDAHEVHQIAPGESREQALERVGRKLAA